MPRLKLECKKCYRIFSPPIMLTTGNSATFINCKSNCPFCNSMENIPDGTFKATVEGFIKLLENNDDSLKEAKELLIALKKVQNLQDLSIIKESANFSIFKEWLPNSPEKIAAYIAIICTVIQFLTASPITKVEYNTTLINQYNQTLNIKTSK